MPGRSDSRLRRCAAFAAAGLCALISITLAACGKDDKPSGPPTGPTSAAPERAPADPVAAGHAKTGRARPPSEAASRLPPGAARDAFEAARTAGKPLFAIVVPASAGLRRFHGEVAGSLLPRTDLLPTLALSHVACLSERDVESIAPGSTTKAALPFAVVVETDGGGGPAAPIVLPSMQAADRAAFVGGLRKAWTRLIYEGWIAGSGVEYAKAWRNALPVIDPAVRAFLDAPRAALRGDAKTLLRRAAAARAALGDATADDIERSVREGIALGPDTADRAAAIVLRAADEWPRMRSVAEGRVGDGARVRLWGHAPPGGRWLSEEPDVWMIDEEGNEVEAPSAASAPSPAERSPNWCGTGQMGPERSVADMPDSPPFLELTPPRD
jgi:hypothetical protein